MDRIKTAGVGEKNGVIQLSFFYEEQRVRPSVLSDAYNERNIRKWAERLNGPNGIKARIRLGCFNFADEFPDYRFMGKVAPAAAANGARTLNQVWESFKAECEKQIRLREMAMMTLVSYRRIYNREWAPKLGHRPFFSIQLSELREGMRDFEGHKKTYNNVVSVLRCIFVYGYMDKPAQNPALGLTCLKLRQKDQAEIDPYSIGEAEAVIAAIHEEWGESQGNYDEFRFFTGLRPSEEITIEVDDCDIERGQVRINKARVNGWDKDCTKNYIDRTLELCPRALEVLKRQLALRAKLILAGKMKRTCKAVFFNEETAEPFRDIQVQWRRWNETHLHTKIRCRVPYNARHSSVSWNLMVDPNKLLWIAEQHGHSVAVMLKTYARWTKGATDADVAAIKRAMQQRPNSLRKAA